MAIAFDAKANGFQPTGGATLTYAHTVSGSNRILLVGYTLDISGTTSITTITYNGVGMTKLNEISWNSGSSLLGLYYLINPSTGANNVVITRTGGATLEGFSASYTGANQLSFPDAQTSGSATNTTSLTTVANNSWIVTIVSGTGTLSGGTNLTLREAGPDNNRGVLDTNGAITPAGSTTLSWTNAGGNAATGFIVASIAPPFIPTSAFFLAASR